MEVILRYYDQLTLVFSDLGLVCYKRQILSPKKKKKGSLVNGH